MRQFAIIVAVGSVLLAGCTVGQDSLAASTTGASWSAAQATEARPTATAGISASAVPSKPATSAMGELVDTTSRGGSLSASIPATWTLCSFSPGLASADALDVLGEWGLGGGCGSADSLAAVESLASPERGVTAEGYYDEAFAPTAADPTLEVTHEVFESDEGREVLLVTVATAENAGVDGATFIVFAGDRLVVGKLASSAPLDSNRVAELRRVAASVVVR